MNMVKLKDNICDGVCSLTDLVGLWATCCVKSVQMRSSFWSIFSRIRTEYGEILRISPYSVRIRENTDQSNSKYGYFLRSDSFSHICNCIIFPTLFSSTFAIKFDEPITGRKSIQTYRSYTYIVSWFMTPSMMGTEQILFLWCTYLHKAKTRGLDICQVNSVVRIASEEWK